MFGKLALLIIAAAAIGWTLHSHQVRRAQQRLRRLGQQLEAHGVSFDQWLAEAKVDRSALDQRGRRDEVQARLIAAAERLLPRP